MPPTLHSAEALLAPHAAPLSSLGLTLAGSFLLGRKSRGEWLPCLGALGLLIGWALVGDGLPRSVWLPHRGAEALLAPALASMLVWGLRAWGLGWPRALLWAEAAFAGWWVAQAGVAPSEFWRVWFVTALLAWMLTRMIAADTARGVALALTLAAGLAVAGAGAGWGTAALVAAAAWAGLLAAESKAALLPAALMAALVMDTDLAGGRLLRGRLDAVDVACLCAVAAPLVTGAIAKRLGSRKGRFLPIAAAALTAVGSAALIYVLRRAVFT